MIQAKISLAKKEIADFKMCAVTIKKQLECPEDAGWVLQTPCKKEESKNGKALFVS